MLGDRGAAWAAPFELDVVTLTWVPDGAPAAGLLLGPLKGGIAWMTIGIFLIGADSPGLFVPAAPGVAEPDEAPVGFCAEDDVP